MILLAAEALTPTLSQGERAKRRDGAAAPLSPGRTVTDEGRSFKNSPAAHKWRQGALWRANKEERALGRG